MDADTLVLFILMRTDLDSLTPGKAMAQANHAFGALKNRVRRDITRQKDYLRWEKQTSQDFGTVIVLGGGKRGIDEALGRVMRLNLPVVAGWVLDPTYPVRDGDVTHLIQLKTCAFVFGTKAECRDACGGFELHP